MASDIWGVLRTVGLWILIICDIGMLLISGLTGQWIWFSVVMGITLWIAGWELYGSLIGFKQPDGTRKKMTISTEFKNYAIKVGWLAYAFLACFITAMAGLNLHLAVWGGMFS
jgi:hypothetical protein